MSQINSVGIAGALIFAFGATIIFSLFMAPSGLMVPPVILYSFIGFFLVGLGLWMIIHARIREKDQTSTEAT